MPYDHFESDFERSLYASRQDTLKKIAALGQQPYPNTFTPPADHPLHTLVDIRAQYDKATGEELEAQRIPVAVAGRIMAIRQQGKAGFATLQQEGARLQIYVRKDAVGDPAFELYKLLDLGDHIGVTGYLFRTRTNELTVHVETITFLAKALLALPEKYHGLADIELRYRRRYVDLFMNPLLNETPAEGAAPAEGATEAQKAEEIHVRDVFIKRAQILRAIRKFFDARGYIEVETPMMQPVAGGAMARPFVTHHNALDIDLFLRIAPELYLKRLVVGGFDRVYEINRNFRNEGISTQHNPEFTMLEFYQAYANYHDLMTLTQELIQQVAQEVNGTTITHFNEVEIDLGKWEKLTMREAIINWWPRRSCSSTSQEDFRNLAAFGPPCTNYPILPRANRTSDLEAERHIWSSMSAFHDSKPELSGLIDEGVKMRWRAFPYWNAVLGRTIAGAFETLAEPHLIQPTIIYEFPLAVSPSRSKSPTSPTGSSASSSTSADSNSATPSPSSTTPKSSSAASRNNSPSTPAATKKPTRWTSTTSAPSPTDCLPRPAKASASTASP